MDNKKIIIIISVIFFCFIMSIIFSLFNLSNDNIISGVSINMFNVSKLNKEEIKKNFDKIITEKLNKSLKLEYTSNDNKTYEKNIDLSILNIEYNLDECIKNAHNLGRSGNIFQNNFYILKTLLIKHNFEFSINLDEKMLDTIIADISANLPDKKINNSYYIEDKNLIITKGVSGNVVDKDAFISMLNNYLKDFYNQKDSLNIPVKLSEIEEIDLEKIHSDIYKEPKDAYFEKEPFKVYSDIEGVDFDIEIAKNTIAKNPNKKEYIIELKYKSPKVKIKDLNINIFKDKLGTFSTKYSESNEDRTTNLKLAANKIDGIILGPGEEFSYNQIVGERSIAAGYKEAKIYQGGEIIDGLGGGICQISSTLYNATVFANLQITQRFNHQFVTSYVPAGRDATVAYGVKDFRFVNNRTYPIKINVSVSAGIAKVDIYGIAEDNDYMVDIEVEVISNIDYETKETIDKSLPSGTEQIKQRGANGVIVEAYKILKKNGITVSKELLSKDTYKPLDRVIVKSKN